MNNNLTDITILLDRSGSMGSTQEDTIGGFNAFLSKQKEVAGEANLALVQFGSSFSQTYSGPIADAPLLDKGSYNPVEHCTKLIDSMCRLIDATGQRLARLPESERPGKVVFVVITDGAENASTEFKKKDLNERVSHQQDIYKWEFVYLGANQDAFLEGATLGVKLGNSATWAQNQMGIQHFYSSLTRNLTEYRTSAKSDMSFTTQDLKAQEEALNATKSTKPHAGIQH